MKISLLTDAPRHNLALMKISTYHRKRGDEVKLNMPLWKADYTYGSWLFDGSYREKTDDEGGIGSSPNIFLLPLVEKLKPDYTLYNLNHSLGYTFRYCPRKCPFCKVRLIPNSMSFSMEHHPIREFHDERFDTIELLNNNTFADEFWEDTFKEIYKAKLKIIEHGMDLRLLDDHKAWWIKKLRWKKAPKFAWDEMKNEKKILPGLNLLKKHKIQAIVYVLIGFDSTMEQNIYRCQKIYDFGCDPFPMLYKPTKELKKFRRMIYLRYYRQHKTIGEAWKAYGRDNQ